MKLTRTILPLVFFASVAPLAQAFFLGEYVPPKVRPPKAVPATQCNLVPYAAFANRNDDAVDTYMLSGSCNINVAPAGKDPVMQKVNVRIEAEWSPKMKRASEQVTIVHPDKTYSFSTWATCFYDPFIVGANATCRDQGMGGDDFSLFINKEDAPFARNRITFARAAELTARVSTRPQIREMGVIRSLEAPAESIVGQTITVKTSFQGGPSACPMEVDFGDGQVVASFDADKPGVDLMQHAYAKPGAYTVKVRALPGCYGEASRRIVVKGASVDSVVAATAGRPGTASSIAISGRAGACKLAIDFGDGKKETVNASFAAAGSKILVDHTYWSPGRKNVSVKGDAGCTGAVVGYVDVPVARIEKLSRMGRVGEFEIVTAQSNGNACPLRVDWGDGVVEEKSSLVFMNGQVNLSHVYKKKGKMLVSARGIDGCVGVAGEWVVVN